VARHQQALMNGAAIGQTPVPVTGTKTAVCPSSQLATALTPKLKGRVPSSRPTSYSAAAAYVQIVARPVI